jgi:hypothetical protein
MSQVNDHFTATMTRSDGEAVATAVCQKDRVRQAVVDGLGELVGVAAAVLDLVGKGGLGGQLQAACSSLTSIAIPS